jgi:hypothetical protein
MRNMLRKLRYDKTKKLKKISEPCLTETMQVTFVSYAKTSFAAESRGTITSLFETCSGRLQFSGD